MIAAPPIKANLPEDEDTYQPITALNDFLFCERRCALHRLENVWTENVYTLEGTAGHKRAHATKEESLGSGGKVVRGMWLRSERLRLVGKADVVEMGPPPFPVEYKRGKRRKWDNDDVQLCAQALCLEEMLGEAIPQGAIFHVKSQRRRVIVFDAALRRLTEETAARLHALIVSGITPPPVLKPRCQGCSLRDLCMPALLQQQEPIRAYLQKLYEATDA